MPRALKVHPDGTVSFADAAVADDAFESEIFATGSWGGYEWTTAHLDAIVQNFAKLREWIKPPLKLGHADKQFLAQTDGQPALGFVDALRRDGDKLIATVRGVPKALRDLIRGGRYRRVSAELYPKFESTSAEANLKSGATGPTLQAVALLGADIPEVKTLDDLPRLLAMERATFSESPPAPGTIVIHPTEEPMPEDVTAELRASITKLSEDLASERAARQKADEAAEKAKSDESERVKLAEAEATKLKETVARLETEAKAAREREDLLEDQRRHDAAVKFVESHSNAGNLRIMPADRGHWVRILEAAEELRSTPIKFAEGDKEREVSLNELVKELITRLPAQTWKLKELGTAEEQNGDPDQERSARFQEITDELKADLSKSEDRKRVAREVARRHPHLVPKYGRAGE